jgi:hypothetical protein
MNHGRTWLRLTFMCVPDKDVIWKGPCTGETNARDNDWRNYMIVISPKPVNIVKPD